MASVHSGSPVVSPREQRRERPTIPLPARDRRTSVALEIDEMGDAVGFLSELLDLCRSLRGRKGRIVVDVQITDGE
jgi:hypothetical protein